jgi:hypothetical protein
MFDLLQLTRQAHFPELAPDEQLLLVGIRCAAKAIRNRCDPVGPMVRGLAPVVGREAAAWMAQLMVTACMAWPEPMVINPCGCNCPVSYDERLLVDLVLVAREGDRPGFDRLVAEMLNEETREGLFALAARVGHAFDVLA